MAWYCALHIHVHCTMKTTYMYMYDFTRVHVHCIVIETTDLPRDKVLAGDSILLSVEDGILLGHITVRLQLQLRG